MRILAFVTRDARRHLERSLASTAKLLPAAGSASLVHAIRTRACDAVVVDPTELDDDQYQKLLEAMSTSTVPALIYAPLNALGARRVVQIAELGPHELMLRGIDDDPGLIRRKLTALAVPAARAVPSMSSELLAGAASRIGLFPDALKTATVELFGAGRPLRWVDELAHSAGIARRTIDRWMLRTGLNGASMLIDAARLARAWEPLTVQKQRPVDVALALGYSRLRLLVSHTRRIVDAEPGEFGTTLSRQEFSARLVRSLVTR